MGACPKLEHVKWGTHTHTVQVRPILEYCQMSALNSAVTYDMYHVNAFGYMVELIVTGWCIIAT